MKMLATPVTILKAMMMRVAHRTRNSDGRQDAGIVRKPLIQRFCHDPCCNAVNRLEAGLLDG
jgi:hypothetical protein